MTEQTESTLNQSSSFETWYVAHFVLGYLYMGFVPILVPSYVLAITGSARMLGIIMGMNGVGLLLAPIVGAITDRLQSYRATQLLGLLLLVCSALIFSIAQTLPSLFIAALLMGLGTAILMMINPAFIVGAQYPRILESHCLTTLNQIAIIGQFMGSGTLALLTRADWSFQARFLMMVIIGAIGFGVTAATNQKAAQHIQVSKPQEKSSVNFRIRYLREILISSFGVLLLSEIFNTVGQQIVWGQYPNYLNQVFHIQPSLSAAALSASALLSLGILRIGGEWMAQAGPRPVYITALILRLGSVVSLMLLADMEGISVFLPLGFCITFSLFLNWIDLTSPELSAQMSSGTIGMTQGFLLGALAIGAIVGNLLGGWAADTIGFSSLPVWSSGFMVLAILLGIGAFSRA